MVSTVITLTRKRYSPKFHRLIQKKLTQFLRDVFIELWEMACARHLGMISTPIVCVNVNNYYEPFRQMLKQAYDDNLIKLKPCDIIRFASTAEEAVRWIESAQESPVIVGDNTRQKETEGLLGAQSEKEVVNKNGNCSRESSCLQKACDASWIKTSLVFAGGIILGLALK